MTPTALRRLASIGTVVAGVALIIVSASAIPPFRGTRVGDAGDTIMRPIRYDSARDAWARTFADNPNLVVSGTTRIFGREWTHTYLQRHCPDGYTLVGNPVIVERLWTPVNTLFVEQGGNAGQLDARVTARTEEEILPRREMVRTYFARVGNQSIWRADVNQWTALLISTGNIRTQANATFRDFLTATAGWSVRFRTSSVDLCSRAIACGDNQCDAGETNAECPADCTEPGMTPPVCGDGTVQAANHEQCDDGNTIDGDGCNAFCYSEECGDGILNALLGEQCDDGNAIESDGCSTQCSDETCGNGIVDGVEDCDDGNTANGDGCDATCIAENPPLIPTCGNWVSEQGEECDDGNNENGDGCGEWCQWESFGSSFSSSSDSSSSVSSQHSSSDSSWSSDGSSSSEMSFGSAFSSEAMSSSSI